MGAVQEASEISEALERTLLEITAIDSPIGEERALCDHLEARFGHSLGNASLIRFHDSLIVRVCEKPGAPRVALVGHLDTVRTSHDGPARVEGTRLYGAGAADMKSGLAVMIELAERVDRSSLPCDLTLIFYEREEGPFEENMLGPLIDNFDLLRELDFAICLEPSSNELQLGCMGSVHCTVHFEGRTAHSARPWQGENAILKAAPFLQQLAEREPNEVQVDGHSFREVLSPTLAHAGGGRNVVPDRFELNLNYRFAPPRTPQQVVDELRKLVGDAAVLEPTDLSPACRPHADHPFVKHLTACGVSGVKIKQAWTDVARFDQVGVPAVNLGPGTQSQAHQPNEYTELPLLIQGYEIFRRFIEGLPVGP
ncbi:MAG: succinyl-diaminopimelate desuccinylase [Myxococcales bacterium]|nr:succinyl-diaminopimelate desuccinylase [Myxococcales bacterium]